MGSSRGLIPTERDTCNLATWSSLDKNTPIPTQISSEIIYSEHFTDRRDYIYINIYLQFFKKPVFLHAINLRGVEARKGKGGNVINCIIVSKYKNIIKSKKITGERQ